MRKIRENVGIFSGNKSEKTSMMIKHRERQGLRAGNRKEEAGIHRNYINAVSSVLMIPWTSRPRHEIIIIMITTSLSSVRSSSS